MASKLYLKIGEIASILNVETSTIRYWEKEFRQLNPIKSSSGQRYYDAGRVDLLKVVYKLMHIDLKSVEETKLFLKDKTAIKDMITKITSGDEVLITRVLSKSSSKHDLKAEIQDILSNLRKSLHSSY